MKKYCFFCFLLLAASAVSEPNQVPIYRNPDAPIEIRIDDLLSRMTLTEKISQLAGTPNTAATADNNRLGIPGLTMADGPHGVVGQGKATCFPSALAQAATWDPDLVGRIAKAIGREFRAKGRYVALGPCINIIRDPRGGRSFETFGEDPYLLSKLAAAYVKGIQSQKVIAVPKHFACNNQENDRTTNNVIIDERTLREFYLPAFRASVIDADTWAIMSAFNKINGEFCSQNKHLLTEILKQEWGFKGFVVSDWQACHATVESITAGLDVEMPYALYYGQPLADAVNNGQVSEKTIDNAVRRILRAKFWAGVFENPPKPDETLINTKEHQALALEVARKSIVLLKNDSKLLPLDKNKIKSIALIGPNADIARTGGGGSAEVTPFYAVSPLQAIKQKNGNTVKINFAKGCDLDLRDSLKPVKQSCLISTDSNSGKQGLFGEYFDNRNLKGPPALKRIDPSVNFDWEFTVPTPEVHFDSFSVKWKGKLIPDKTADYLLGTISDGGVRLYLDGKLLIDDWHDFGPRTHTIPLHFKAGVAHDICLEYFQTENWARVKLCWLEVDKTVDPFAQARQTAKNSDVAIVAVGTASRIETEGGDRYDLALPGQQDQLIKAVTQANPNTIVLLINGSAVLMDDWIDKVPAILQCWFGGQEAGNAIADVLFSDENPGGKLPITLPQTQDQLPPFDNNYETAGQGRGYRYYEKYKKEPQFPFGHGLSYTSFEYKNLCINPKQSRIGHPVTVSLDIRNTGSRTGDEVVQLYVHDVKTTVDRAPKELKAFKRLTLKPNETSTVTFTLDDDAFSFYDVASKKFIVESGEFEIILASSSKDIRLKGRLTKK